MTLKLDITILKKEDIPEGLLKNIEKTQKQNPNLKINFFQAPKIPEEDWTFDFPITAIFSEKEKLSLAYGETGLSETLDILNTGVYDNYLN